MKTTRYLYSSVSSTLKQESTKQELSIKINKSDSAEAVSYTHLGGLVEVHDFDGYFMGIGYINRRSKITVRMMSRRTREIDRAFIEQRVRACVDYRKHTVDMSSCRLIFGEADFLPGIVIDKFSDVLVVASLALGIDRFKPLIVELLSLIHI